MIPRTIFVVNVTVEAALQVADGVTVVGDGSWTPPPNAVLPSIAPGFA